MGRSWPGGGLASQPACGPAAATYKQRVRTGATRYAGRVLRTTREARDLLANPDIQIVKAHLYAVVINEMSARLDRNTQSGQRPATVTQLRRQPLS